MTKEDVLARFSSEKNAVKPLELEFRASDDSICRLRMITKDVFGDPSSIELFARWREASADAFPAQFRVTIEGTKIWTQKAVLENPERILFWVIDANGNKIGHIGLFRLSEDAQQIEIDNIVRGEISTSKRIIFNAIKRMLKWQREELGIKNSYLRVFSNNESALKLYAELGYEEVQRAPLKRVESEGRVDWKEIVQSPYERAEKYFVTMFQAKQV